MTTLKKDDLLNSSKELKGLFEEYLNDARVRLLNILKVDEKACANGNLNNSEGYAKCMTAFEKDFKQKVLELNFKASFFKRNIEDCMTSSVYKANKGEGTKYCMKIAKDQMDAILKKSD